MSGYSGVGLCWPATVHRYEIGRTYALDYKIKGFEAAGLHINKSFQRVSSWAMRTIRQGTAIHQTQAWYCTTRQAAPALRSLLLTFQDEWIGKICLPTS